MLWACRVSGSSTGTLQGAGRSRASAEGAEVVGDALQSRGFTEEILSAPCGQEAFGAGRKPSGLWFPLLKGLEKVTIGQSCRVVGRFYTLSGGHIHTADLLQPQCPL